MAHTALLLDCFKKNFKLIILFHYIASAHTKTHTRTHTHKQINPHLIRLFGFKPTVYPESYLLIILNESSKRII